MGNRPAELIAILVCVVVVASALTLGSSSRAAESGPKGPPSAPGLSPLASASRDAPTAPEIDHPGASGLGGVLSTLNLADNQSFPGNASPAIQSGPQVIVYNPKNGEFYVRGSLGSAISILDGSTDRVVTTLGVPYSEDAYSLAPNIAVDTSTGVVYATNFNEGNVTVIDGETNQVTGSIATGGSPASAVFDPSNGDLYVANWGGDNVTVLSCATNSTVANIPVGTHPASILYDAASQRVFVANYGSGNVSVINASTNTWAADLRTGTTSSYPEDLALDTSDNYVDAISELNTNVTIFNATTLAVVGSPHVGSIPEELAYSPIGDAVYVTNSASGNVTVISQSTSAPVANITTGTVPFGVVYDAVDEEVYVLNSEGQNITVLDTSSQKAIANVDSNAGLDYAVAVDSATGDVFALNEGTYTGSVRGVEANVTVVEDATNLPIASIPLNVFSTGLTYDPANGKLIVSDVAGEDVYALNPATGLTAKTAPAGFAWASAYDSATGCVWVLNRGSDNITVLNSGLHSVANLSTGGDPVAIAFDAANGDLYVTDDIAGNVTVYNGATDTYLTTILVKAFDNLGAVLYDPHNTLVYVADMSGSNLTVINGTQQKIVGAVAVGSETSSLAFDSKNDTVWAANLASSNATVINDSTGDTVANVTMNAPGSLAFDAANDVMNDSEDFESVVAGVGASNYSALGSIYLKEGAYTSAIAYDPVNSYVYVSMASAGTIAVIGPWAPTYAVTFTETGLPVSSLWNVTLNGVQNHSTGSSIGFEVAAGHYPFTVGVVSGYLANNTSGTVVVTSGSQTIEIHFTLIPFTVSLTANPTTLRVGGSTTITATPEHGVGPYTYVYTHVPTGCSAPNESTFVCVPNATGSFNLTVTVTDSDHATAVNNTTVSVQPAGGGGGNSPSTPTSLWEWSIPVVVALVVVLLVVGLMFRRKRKKPEPSVGQPTAAPGDGPPPATGSP